jgi:SAM-dependent methyltransferase
MSFKIEEDIRPRNVFKELLECCKQDAEYLVKNGEFESIPCPACLTEGDNIYFVKHGFSYIKCSSCSTLYNSPRPTEATFNKFYTISKSSKYFFESFYPAVEKSRKDKLIPERIIRVEQFFQANGNDPFVLLDIGAGQGFFFDLMKENHPEFEYRVIEPNESLAEVCKQKGYEAVVDFVENVRVWKNEVDFIICFEVFEHVREPRDFLLQLKSFLKPGGKLLITSLSGSGLDIEYLKDEADIVAPPQHLNFLSIEGYKSIFNQLGFSNLEIITPGRLDVNIIMNKLSEKPELKSDSLIQFISSLSDENKDKLQKIAADNLLSSHIWVIATCL